MSAPLAMPFDATPLPPPVTEPPPREVHVPESRLVEARPAKSTQTETHPADVPRELRTLEERPTELRTVQRPAIPPEARYAGSDTLPDDDRIPQMSAVLDAPPPDLVETDEAAGTLVDDGEESLEEFVARFRYTPPSADDELTMTGELPVLDAKARFHADEPVSLAEEPVVEPHVDPVLQNPIPDAPVPDATVDRSRFLDFGDESTGHRSAELGTSGTSTIVVPSFLGLNHPPAPTGTMLADEAEPSRSHWRAWVAALVLILFAGLGYLEWRVVNSQPDSEPLAVMKMQVERVKDWAAATISRPASHASSDASPKPEMQMVPQSKPQQPTPAATPASPEDNSAANPAAAKPWNATTQPPPNGQAPNSANASPSPGIGTNPSATDSPSEPAAPPRTTSAQNTTTTAATVTKDEARPAKQAPGEDEMQKADQASDAAAASAWLWKAVAKGNPEAPVRLANLYIKGDGIPRNCEQALVLLKSAAATENAPARSRLGSLYATGNCVPRDRVKAYEWMTSSLQANPNSQWARQYRDELWTRMTPSERAQAQKYR